MDNQQQIILIAVLAVIALLLDWQVMRWLKKRNLGFKKLGIHLPKIRFPRYHMHPVQVDKPKVVEPEVPRPPFQILLFLDFITSLALIGLGQYLLASDGNVSYGISILLNEIFFLDTPNLDNVLIAIPVLVVGCILLARTLRRFNLPGGETNAGGLRQNILPLVALKTRSVLPWLGGASLVFIFFVLLQLRNKVYSGWTVALWLLVPLVFLVVAWRWDRQSGTALSPNLTRGDLLWMTGLVLAGVLVASFHLQSLPNQMIGDEGTFWTTARDIALGIYHPAVFDFGVYTYGILSSIGQAAALKVFGITFWGWRFSSVLAGVITIPPLYLLGREMFDRRVAVVSSIALITAPYFLAFARLGYNNIQTLFIVTLAIYWFYLGYKRSSAFYLFLAGCAAGLGKYTYSAAGSLVPIVFLFLLACLIYRRQNFRSLLKAGIIFTLGWVLLSLPQTVYGMAVSPESASTKFLESIFFNTGYSSIYLHGMPAFDNAAHLLVGETTLFFAPGPYAILLIRGVFRTFLSFHQSYLVTEHFISSPLAGPFAVVFYIIGATMALAGIKQRRFAILLIWFGFMALALSAATTFPPRHQHMVGLIPALVLLIGAGLVTLVDLLGKLVPRLSRRVQMVFIGLLALGISVTGVYNYFVTMPSIYSPNFEQIISWYGLYAKGQSFYYAYSSLDRPDFKPYILSEVRKDVPYKDVSAADLAAHPLLTSFDPYGIVFFPPEATNQVLPALQKIWRKFPQTASFYNHEGLLIGGAAWQPPLTIVLPLTFSAQLADSYNRPIAWLLVFLAGLLIFFLAARRAWFGRAPARLKWVLDWPFQPAEALESWPRPVRAPKTAKGRRPRPDLAARPLTLAAAAAETGSLDSPASYLGLPEVSAILSPGLPAVENLSQSAAVERHAPISPPAETPQLAAADHRSFIEIEFRLRVNLPGRVSEHFASLPRPVVEKVRPEPAARRVIPTPRLRIPRPTWQINLPHAFFDRVGAVRQRLAGESTVSLVLGLLALGLAVYGQYGVFFKREVEPWIWYMLAGAGIFFLLSMLVTFPGQTSDEPDGAVGYLISVKAIRVRLIVFAAILSLAVLGILRVRDDNTQHWDLFAEWIASILLYLVAFMPRFNLRPMRAWLRQNWKSLIPLGVIMLVGLVLRVYRLDSLPQVMENDEATVGLHALDVLNGTMKNMFQTWSSFGTLHFFLMAIPVGIFGQTRFAIRILTALAGVATLPVVYLLALKMFDRKVALISTVLVAVTHIHIQFSRISPAASSLDPLLSALSVYLIYRAFQTRRLFDWALSGIVMGLALYFYVGARVLIGILGCALVLLAIFKWKLLRQNWRGLLLCGGAYLLVAAPMLLWAVTHTDAFNVRVQQVGILYNGWLADEMIRQGASAVHILLQQLGQSLLIFNYHSARWFYDATVPMLGPLTGILLSFGLLAALPRLRDLRFVLLNSWFWVTLIAGQVLMVDPPPNAYRTLGLFPAVCILAAVALTCLTQALVAGWRKHAARAAVVLIILALLGETGWNTWYYFGVWGPAQAYSDANSRRASLIGDYLGQQPPGTLAYIASSNDFRGQGWASLEFLRKQTPYQDIDKPMAEFMPEVPLASHHVFIFPPGRENELSVVEQAFPGGKRYEQYLGTDLYFIAYQK